MFQLGKTIVSEDIIKKDFVCNLSACKGACCVDGDAGAPLDESETKILTDIYSKVKPFLELSQDFEQEDKCLLFTSGNHDLDDLVLLDGLDLLGEGLAANDTEWMRFPLENDLSYVSGYETIREFEDLIVISIRWFSWALGSGWPFG